MAKKCDLCDGTGKIHTSTDFPRPGSFFQKKCFACSGTGEETEQDIVSFSIDQDQGQGTNCPHCKGWGYTCGGWSRHTCSYCKGTGKVDRA